MFKQVFVFAFVGLLYVFLFLCFQSYVCLFLCVNFSYVNICVVLYIYVIVYLFVLGGVSQ